MSGSGKTTLVKMLLGFYPPAKGEITLGGINLNNYNIRQWRKKMWHSNAGRIYFF